MARAKSDLGTTVLIGASHTPATIAPNPHLGKGGGERDDQV
jgi:hypothetical protein